MNWKKIGSFALGFFVCLAAEEIIIQSACTGSQADAGLSTIKAAAPVLVATPVGPTGAAVADFAISGMQGRLAQLEAQQRAMNDQLVASGQKPAPEPKLGLQEWAYILLGGLGVGGAALKASSSSTKSALTQLATGVATAIGAQAKGAAPQLVSAILSDHLPGDASVDHATVADQVAQAIVKPA